MNKKRYILFFIMLALVFSAASGENCVSTPSPQTIKIMSFNIQIFGAAKMARPEVVEILVDLVSQADIIVVQEVRSIHIDPVQRFMALLPDRYDYVIGPRQGRSNSKEQYWVIYDSEKFTVLEYDSWPDTEDIFERSPFSVYFKTSGAFDFTLINNHIRPSDAEKEIRALPSVVTYYIDLWDDPDVLVVGDLNADGRYFDKTLLDSIFPEEEYKIIFSDEDTTVAASRNTYDRIIITSSAADYFTGNFGVIRFDEVYDFSELSIRPSQVSDHYPVWAEFLVDSSTE
jgi:endonuclease/exonuclease/phosphatase family metal-dependent hydrolase